MATVVPMDTRHMHCARRGGAQFVPGRMSAMSNQGLLNGGARMCYLLKSVCNNFSKR